MNLIADRTEPERTILVIGGAGYIGSVLTPRLLEANFRVRVLDRLLYEHGDTILPWIRHPDYEFRCGDFADPAVLEDALQAVTDVVFLAGLVGDPITKNYPAESRKINEQGYVDGLPLLDDRGLNRVIFVSTCSNYGLIEGNELADENFELNPLSLYAKAKVRIEQELLAREGNVDYTATILRFATAFGLSPRMRFDLTISEFVREVWSGRELLVYDPDTWRPYCHVRDFANVIEGVLTAPADAVSFEVFNAGGDANNYTKRMIVHEIEKRLPEAVIRYQEHGADPRNYRVDFGKIRERLNFEPHHTVIDGIEELVAALGSRLFDNVDARRNFHGNYEINYP